MYYFMTEKRVVIFYVRLVATSNVTFHILFIFSFRVVVIIVVIIFCVAACARQWGVNILFSFFFVLKVWKLCVSLFSPRVVFFSILFHHTLSNFYELIQLIVQFTWDNTHCFNNVNKPYFFSYFYIHINKWIRFFLFILIKMNGQSCL